MPVLFRKSKRSASTAVKIRSLAVPALMVAVPPSTSAVATARFSASVSTSAASSAECTP
jgi:hypothetical protein